MKVGDLGRYVGHAKFYEGRLGTIAEVFVNHFDGTAQVYYPGIAGEGRDAPGLGQVHDGLHPMAYDELEVINESR